MSDLQKHIDTINAKSKAWMDEKPGRIAGMTPNAEFWAEQGVTTVEQYERYNMEAAMSDMAKEAYGTRSACPNTSGMTFEDLKTAYYLLMADMNRTHLENLAFEKHAIEVFEEAVANAMAIGNVERTTAVRWLRDAEQDEMADHDDNYFEYCYGLPYGYIKEKTTNAQED